MAYLANKTVGRARRSCLWEISGVTYPLIGNLTHIARNPSRPSSSVVGSLCDRTARTRADRTTHGQEKKRDTCTKWPEKIWFLFWRKIYSKRRRWSRCLIFVFPGRLLDGRPRFNDTKEARRQKKIRLLFIYLPGDFFSRTFYLAVIFKVRQRLNIN